MAPEILPRLLLLLATGSRTAAATAAAAPIITVSCVGDSITVADGNECYPNQLAKLLGPGYNVTNRGVSGHTMLNSGLCASEQGVAYVSVIKGMDTFLATVNLSSGQQEQVQFSPNLLVAYLQYYAGD